MKDPDSPIYQLYQLLPKFLVTLNLIINSRLYPDLLAHAYPLGLYDFNKCPMVPPVTLVIFLNKPRNRTSWDYHDTLGW